MDNRGSDEQVYGMHGEDLEGGERRERRPGLSGSDSLGLSDASWVRSLAHGTNWILGGISLGVLVAIVAAFYISTHREIFEWLSLGTHGLYVFGVWKVTRPEPGLSRTDAPKVRAFTRWAQVAAYGSMVAGVVAMMARRSDGAIMWSRGGSGVFGVAAFFGLLLYLKYLAAKIPDPKLAQSVRTLIWGFAIALGGVIATMGLWIGVGTGVKSIGDTDLLLLVPACMGSVLFLLLAIGWFVVLLKFQSAFHTALVQVQSRDTQVSAPGVDDVWRDDSFG